MASFSGSFLPLVVGLILAYHAVILVEGGRALASRLSVEEDLELERQLNILNKPPIKTMHTRWGDIYDCIEFLKQPSLDHPLLKNRGISKKDKTTPASPHKKLLSQIEGCPKGTVPIRRTTKEDLIRAKYVSSSSNSPGDEYRAGITLEIQGERFFGASGVLNIWHPYVNHPGQFSGSDIALKAGTEGQTNEIRAGWIVNPQLYGDALTRSFAYWTGGNNTGCYNTLCPGFVQVDPTYTPVMLFENTSIISGTQIKMATIIEREPENGDWWLTFELDEETSIKVGYWPSVLFPILGKDGAEHIYWGGRVKAGTDGITPEMASAFYPNKDDDHTGYYGNLKYYDKDDQIWLPDHKAQSVVDCKGYYEAKWDDFNTILRYGGPGGGTCSDF
ncbi:hypothetical protein MKX01_004588 [Papaver californicum]|nr:hypothetical protein MKX01_004588 [Papaver californicum]